MSIIKKKYFAMFMEPQRKWLNEMAAKGYRLVRVGKLEYEFEECEPRKYVYEIEYVGDKSYEHEKEYKEFLESFGYKVFYKNINLDYSVGKVTWRPFAEKGGQLSTNRTTYNKELLIIEKENDGRPFELHSTPTDKISYYKRLRNPWIILAAALLIPGALLLNIILLLLGLLFTVPAVRAELAIIKCRKEAEATDAGGYAGESGFIRIFVPIAVVLLVISFIIGASGLIDMNINSKSGIFLGYAESHYKGVFDVSYAKANGTVIRTLSPKGEVTKVTGTIRTDSGTLGIVIKDKNGAVLWERPEGVINEDITISTSGEKVVIYLDMNKCEGRVSLEYK